MALNLTHNTPAKFVARFRQRYKTSSREQKARLAHWLYSRYVAGDITEAQIRTAFNLVTQLEWTTFRDKVLALHDHWQAIRDEGVEA